MAERECRRVTGKLPVTTRWVDVNKGDDINPNVRSPLVSRQIRQVGKWPYSLRRRRWTFLGAFSRW